ncbi:MAG: response regulator [Candidatus Omnitrophica bacterium]|nr:response regulator [Candidatus Omnitrophota bacterium]
MNKPVILVVDDESEARSVIITFLKDRYECDFFEAEDGEEAVKFVQSRSCDVMILDIKMPKKNGMAVIKEAKGINAGLDILIISGWVSDDVAKEAMDSGATDYAVKPMDLKAINLKFAGILDKRGQKISKI